MNILIWFFKYCIYLMLLSTLIIPLVFEFIFIPMAVADFFQALSVPIWLSVIWAMASTLYASFFFLAVYRDLANHIKERLGLSRKNRATNRAESISKASRSIMSEVTTWSPNFSVTYAYDRFYDDLGI